MVLIVCDCIVYADPILIFKTKKLSLFFVLFFEDGGWFFVLDVWCGCDWVCSNIDHLSNIYKIVMRLSGVKVSQGVQRWPMELIKGGFIVAMKKPFTSAY